MLPIPPPPRAGQLVAHYHGSSLPGLYCSTLIDDGPLRGRVHDRLVLWTLTAGQAVLRYRGAVHTLRPGAVLLAEPGEVHADLRKDECRVIMAVLRPVLVNAFANAPGRVLGPAVSDDPGLSAALHRLVGAVREQEPCAAQERAAAAVFRALAPLWTPPSTRPTPPLVARAQRVLLESTGGALSLGQLAERLGCAPSYLSRVFTAHMGLGPCAYQLQGRLLQARAYIESGVTIAAAAGLTGFTDESHLHRHFRRRFAAAPGSYHHELAQRRPHHD